MALTYPGDFVGTTKAHRMAWVSAAEQWFTLLPDASRPEGLSVTDVKKLKGMKVAQLDEMIASYQEYFGDHVEEALQVASFLRPAGDDDGDAFMVEGVDSPQPRAPLGAVPPPAVGVKDGKKRPASNSGNRPPPPPPPAAPSALHRLRSASRPPAMMPDAGGDDTPAWAKDILRRLDHLEHAGDHAGAQLPPAPPPQQQSTHPWDVDAIDAALPAWEAQPGVGGNVLRAMRHVLVYGGTPGIDEAIRELHDAMGKLAAQPSHAPTGAGAPAPPPRPQPQPAPASSQQVPAPSVPAPQPQYAPQQQYAPPMTQYGQPPAQHNQPQTQYVQPPTQYGQPQTQYGQPPTQYGQPPAQHNQPQTQYGQPPTQYGQQPPQYSRGHMLVQPDGRKTWVTAQGRVYDGQQPPPRACKFCPGEMHWFWQCPRHGSAQRSGSVPPRSPAPQHGSRHPRLDAVERACNVLAAPPSATSPRRFAIGALRPASRDSYRAALRSFAGYLRGAPTHGPDVDEDVAGFLVGLAAAGRARTTIAGTLSALRFAGRVLGLPITPNCDLHDYIVRAVPRVRGQLAWIHPTTLAILLGRGKETRRDRVLQALAALSYFHAMRVSEALRVRPCDFDLPGGRVRIHPSKKRGDALPVW
eukprot:gene1097-2957_t